MAFQHGLVAALVPTVLLLHLILSTQLPAAHAQLQGIGDFMGLFRPWPFQCQDPLALGQPCVDDYDCNAAQGHHCHIRDRVCARGQPAGAPCNGGNGCAPGLGCKLHASPMECYPIECNPQPDGSESCVQGPTLGISCTFENATTACPVGAQCNMATPPQSAGFGVCAPLPTEEGADCSFFVGHPVCGAPLMCLMGTGVCGKGGGLGEPCPILPDRCDVDQGLTCISETVEPFTSSCLPARRAGEHCNSGGECGKGLFCDLHTLSCTPIRPAGSGCRNGNECGEAPFDDHIGVDCVRRSCVDTSRAGANCWPNLPHSQCTNGWVCRRTAAAAAAERARIAEAEAVRGSVEVGAQGAQTRV